MKTILKLIRINLSLAVAFSTLPGFFLAARALNWKALAVFLGVFFLSGGASALNQLQERERDALMPRTRTRPLPSGRIGPAAALIIAVASALAGLLALFFGAGPVPDLLGAFNLAWYNLIYTPLKTKTRFALFAGAVTGAVPIAIGWTAAGGDLLSPALFAIMLFMYLWQIPHFLLLAVKYGEEYATAGFPRFLASASERRRRVTILLWVLGTLAATALFPIFHVLENKWLLVGMVFLDIGIAACFFLPVLFPKKIGLFSAGRFLYLYQLLVLIGIIIQALVKN